MNKKAVLLFSGGLDSILSYHLLNSQQIDILALRFLTPFFKPKLKNFPSGSKHKEIILGRDYLEIIKHPKYGYGRNLNPCIDCKIFMLNQAKEIMRKLGASFIITGEVLGQRPMSQKKPIFNLMEKETGLRGLIVRPLSAKLLKETLPEKAKIIDRLKLLDIQGRSRKVQLSLASSLGIKNYFTPAGGCLLTDAGFSRRLRDLIDSKALPSLNDIALLRLGRHFRISEGQKVIISRNEKEARSMLALSPEGIVIKPLGNFWLVAIIQGSEDLSEAILIFGYYAYKFFKKKRLLIEIISRNKRSRREEIVCNNSLVLKPL